MPMIPVPSANFVGVEGLPVAELRPDRREDAGQHDDEHRV